MGVGHTPTKGQLIASGRLMESCIRFRLGWRWSGVALLVFLWPCVVWAQIEEAQLEAGDEPAYRDEEVEEVPFQGDIGLDRLLQLPVDGVYGGDVRQGANARVWRRRFAEEAEAVTVG